MLKPLKISLLLSAIFGFAAPAFVHAAPGELILVPHYAGWTSQATDEYQFDQLAREPGEGASGTDNERIGDRHRGRKVA